MMSESCSIIKEFLEEVKAGNMAASGIGLCSNFNYFCRLRDLSDYKINCTKEILRSMFRNFPKYTGDPTYPLVPLEEYEEQLAAHVDFFDITQPQGKIRHEFIDWALKEIAENRVSYMKS